MANADSYFVDQTGHISIMWQVFEAQGPEVEL